MKSVHKSFCKRDWGLGKGKETFFKKFFPFPQIANVICFFLIFLFFCLIIRKKMLYYIQ